MKISAVLSPFNSSTIIDEEKQALISLAAEFSKSKTSIIQTAAKKLKDTNYYDEDLTQISAILREELKNIVSESLIFKSLPEIYKKRYNSKEKKIESLPKTLLQEFFAINADNCQALSDIYADIEKKISKDPELEKKVEQALQESFDDIKKNLSAYAENFKKQYCNVTVLVEYLGLAKETAVEIHQLKKLLDYRSKLSTYMKVRLKMLFISGHSLNNIARAIGHEQKWMGVIEKDPFLLQLVNFLKLCPCCGWNMEDYVENLRYAADHMTAMPPIHPIQHICGNCKEPFTIVKAKPLHDVPLPTTTITQKFKESWQGQNIIQKCDYVLCDNKNHIFDAGDEITIQYTSKNKRLFYHPKCAINRKKSLFNAMIERNQ